MKIDIKEDIYELLKEFRKQKGYEFTFYEFYEWLKFEFNEEDD